MPKRIDKSIEPEHSPSPEKESEKLIIYQFFPRIFTNTNNTCKPWGTLQENGSGKLNDLTPRLLHSLREMGINALWLTGVIEHATKTDFTAFGIKRDNPDIIKGEAGSVYAIKDYYDIDPALADDVQNRMSEFESAVDRIHEAGMKVIIDFVPNHTAREYHSDSAPAGIVDFGATDNKETAFSPSNNYYYIPGQSFNTASITNEDSTYHEFPAKATGNDCFSPSCSQFDWYETVKLNYGKNYFDQSEHYEPIPDTWNKMIEILLFWASKGVDGFRCDMVFMVPLPFWHHAIPKVKASFPNIIFIGEIYDVWQYRPFLDYGCFDYLYDKVNLYDTLVAIERYGCPASSLSETWKAVDGIGSRMLNFLENHDEVRFASSEYAAKAQNVIPSLVTSAMMSKGPFMIYYGQELGEDASENEGFSGYNNRTTIFDYWTIKKLNRWYNSGLCDGENLTDDETELRNLYSKVLNLCNSLSSVRNGEFFDLMYVNLDNPSFDCDSFFSWLRYDHKEILLFIANFSDHAGSLKLNIPELAFEMAGILEDNYMSHDLLHGHEHKISIARAHPLSLEISAKDALIIPLKKLNNLNIKK